MKFSRRRFLKGSAGAAAAGMAGASGSGRAGDDTPLARRPLGETGEKLSIVGLGGLVVAGVTQKHANNVVAKAYDNGVNYYDVAPTYGNAEQLLGPALKPYRDKAFLACKTQKRDAKGAREELENSLRHLKTDHVDLYQLHAIRDVEKDVKKAFAPGGAMETFLKAREEGKVRYLGFSAHSAEAALTALKEFRFDTILYPVNYTCHFQGQFDQRVVKAARERGAAVLCLKGLCRQRRKRGQERVYDKCWYEPITDEKESDMAFRWTLSQPVTAAVPPAAEPLFWRGLEIGQQFTPVTEEETDRLRKMTKGLRPLFTFDGEL